MLNKCSSRHSPRIRFFFINVTDGTYSGFSSPLYSDNYSSSEAFGVDLTPDEVAFLKSIPTVSSECGGWVGGCLDSFNLNAFLYLDHEPDFWISIDDYGKYVEKIIDITGKPPIYIDTTFENGHLCRDQDGQWDEESKNADKCYFRSAIDVINRTIALAEFLGFELDDAEDQKNMCEASMRFSSVAEAAHKRGVRAAPVKFHWRHGFLFGIVRPTTMFTRTLEELGMPLIHPSMPPQAFNESSSWFVNCQGGQDYASCNDATFYNVDFWLVDDESKQKLDDLEFVQKFLPDKAILAGQVANIPWNDAALLYGTVARFLNDIADRLETAKSFYADRGCQDVDVTSNEYTSLANFIKGGSIEPGNVACFNRQYLQDAYTPCYAGSGVGFSISEPWPYLLATFTWFLLL